MGLVFACLPLLASQAWLRVFETIVRGHSGVSHTMLRPQPGIHPPSVSKLSASIVPADALGSYTGIGCGHGPVLYWVRVWGSAEASRIYVRDGTLANLAGTMPCSVPRLWCPTTHEAHIAFTCGPVGTGACNRRSPQWHGECRRPLSPAAASSQGYHKRPTVSSPPCCRVWSMFPVVLHR